MYRRPPNRTQKFPGILRNATPSTLIIQSRLTLEKPHKVEDSIIADTGYYAIWFIFRDKWFDIGKIYDRSGNWLGFYCDIIMPVRRLMIGSRTAVITDLFLDVWLSADQKYYVLDEDEFEYAVQQRVISKHIARQARAQLRNITRKIDKNLFPPRLVKEVQLWS